MYYIRYSNKKHSNNYDEKHVIKILYCVAVAKLKFTQSGPPLPLPLSVLNASNLCSL